MPKDNEEENFEEIKAKMFKFGVEGDTLTGTLLDVTKTSSPDAYNKLSMIYKVKAQSGSFHGSTKNEKTKKFVLDTEPTVVEPGEEYVFFVSQDKGVLIGAMKDIKLGQKFKITFVESKPTTKGNDVKIVKVFAGKNSDGTPLMDAEYVKAHENDMTADELAADLKKTD